MPDRRPLVALSVGLFVLLHGPAALRGPGLTADGAHYVGIAHQLVSAGRLADPIGYLGQTPPVTSLHWPPGFPLLVAGLGALGVDLLTAARALAFLGGVVTVALGTRLAARLPDPGAWLVALGVTFLPALGLVSTHALSDTTATAATLAALLALDHARRADAPPAAALAALAVVATVWLRWSGVALVAPLLLTAWWTRAPTRWTLLVVSALGVLPLALWAFAHPDAPRAPAEGGVSLLVSPVANTVKVWALFTLGLGVVPLAAANGAPLAPDDPQAPATPPLRETVTLHAAFAGAHLLLLLLGALRVRMDSVDLRLLLPATPSVLFAAVAAARHARARLPERPLRALAVGALVLPALVGVGRPDEGPLLTTVEALGPRLAALPPGTEIWTELPALAPLAPALRWVVLQEAPNTPWRPDARPAQGEVLAVLRASDAIACDAPYCLVTLSAE